MKLQTRMMMSGNKKMVKKVEENEDAKEEAEDKEDER